jgi:hypothetical protein
MDVIPTPPNVETLQCNVSTTDRFMRANTVILRKHKFLRIHLSEIEQ